jgi:hypothetical protein
VVGSERVRKRSDMRVCYSLLLLWGEKIEPGCLLFAPVESVLAVKSTEHLHISSIPAGSWSSTSNKITDTMLTRRVGRRVDADIAFWGCRIV